METKQSLIGSKRQDCAVMVPTAESATAREKRREESEFSWDVGISTNREGERRDLFAGVLSSYQCNPIYQCNTTERNSASWLTESFGSSGCLLAKVCRGGREEVWQHKLCALYVLKIPCHAGSTRRSNMGGKTYQQQ